MRSKTIASLPSIVPLLVIVLFLSPETDLLALHLDASTPLEPVNIEHMVRGYFYAGVRPEDEPTCSGCGRSENVPRQLTDDKGFIDGQLQLIALPNQVVPFAGKYEGMVVLLINQQFPFCSRDFQIAPTALRETPYAIAKSRLQLDVSSQNGNCCS